MLRTGKRAPLNPSARRFRSSLPKPPPTTQSPSGKLIRRRDQEEGFILRSRKVLPDLCGGRWRRSSTTPPSLVKVQQTDKKPDFCKKSHNHLRLLNDLSGPSAYHL